MVRTALRHIALLAVAVASRCPAADTGDTRTRAFDSRIRTIQVRVDGDDYAPPIISLDGSQKITVSFDEMKDDRSYLRYSLVHCNADWRPSSLVESEYVDGFNYADIDDYSYSSGTFQQFVHYSFSLPNDDMHMLVSGNYIVRVYPENEPDRILLQARLMVCEDAVDVAASVTSRTDVDYNRSHQQVSFEVDTKSYDVRDIYSDLMVYVTQNSRLDNEVLVRHPLRATPRKAVFEHNRDLIFPAGNEFRRMETVAITYHTMGVLSMEYHHPYYHATLVPDQTRSESIYLYDETQWGRFTVRNAEMSDADTNADYIVTHFILDTGKQITGGKIYIDGDLTNHIFDSKSLMKYDSATGYYRADLMLKQGAYNYQYLFVPDGYETGYTYLIEGDKYQTVNEYLVRVYNRKTGERYDRFVGYGTVYSGK